MTKKTVFNNKPLKINSNRPASEAFLNSFFRVFSPEQLMQFEQLYIENEAKIKAINMSTDVFMKQVSEAYKRYQTLKNIDQFTPMDKKGFQYVENFMRTSIEKIYALVLKKQSHH